MKRILAALLVLIIALSCFVACKPKTPAATTPNTNTGETPETAPKAPDYDFMGNDLTQFVTLGQYKGYELEVEPMLEITDEYFEEALRRDIILYGQKNALTEGTVTENDIIKIKYVGYLNGEKFEGGEGTKDDFTVYNGGGFIEGFATGIIGATVGVEFDLNVTFPEDYHAADLAGKPVVFKVTVEAIYEAKEMTDELVKSLSSGEMETVEEFRKQARELLEKNAKTDYDNAKIDAVWEKIFESSVRVSLPKDIIDQYYEYSVYYYKQYATNSWMTLEAFLESIGYTLEDVRKEAEDGFFTDAVVYSLIKAENITVDDEYYNKKLTEAAESSNVTVEYIEQYYGGKEAVKEMLLYTKAYESVLEWNTFIDKTPDAE